MSAGRAWKPTGRVFQIVLVVLLAAVSAACKRTPNAPSNVPTRPVSPPVSPPIDPPMGLSASPPINPAASSHRAPWNQTMVAFLMGPLGGTTTSAFFVVLFVGAFAGFIQVLGTAGEKTGPDPRGRRDIRKLP